MRVLDNLSSGRLTNLQGLDDKVEFIEGDIRDAALCHTACEGVETVLSSGRARFRAAVSR